MAVLLDVLHRVTDEELLALSDRNPGYQIERTSDGRLVVSPTSSRGGRESGEVFGQLRDWNRRSVLGVVFDSSTGFTLPDGSCRSPDASWVQRDRWTALTQEQQDSYAPLCPDAVFEVRSGTDSLTELQAKMEMYKANGARIGVLIDPQSRVALVYRPGQPVERHADRVPLDPELPGFVLELAPVCDD